MGAKSSVYKLRILDATKLIVGNNNCLRHLVAKILLFRKEFVAIKLNSFKGFVVNF